MLERLRMWLSLRTRSGAGNAAMPDKRTLAIIDAAIVSEDTALMLYEELAKRERRGEKIPVWEIWRQLQLIYPRIRRYESYCRDIDQRMGFKDPADAIKLIMRRREGKLTVPAT